MRDSGDPASPSEANSDVTAGTDTATDAPVTSPSRASVDSVADADTEGVDVGILVAPSPQGDGERLRSFAERMVADAGAELRASTPVKWEFHPPEVDGLPDGGRRRPSEFIDDASLRIVEGLYDVFVVVTDVPLVSSRQRVVAGLASPVSRTVVVSTRKLLVGRREQPRSLDDPAVRWNAATLLVHLIGHVLGADHEPGDGAMAPYRFDPERRSVPSLETTPRGNLERMARRIPPEPVDRDWPEVVSFHLRSLARNPGEVLRAVAGSGALTLPLSLPKLATAAVTPTLILVFSAETWDVGLHLGDGVAALFAAVSVVAAAVHLMFVHDLTFPVDPGRTTTEHMALVNVAVFLILLTGMVGLFLLVGGIILVVEVVVFPPNLMTNWPSLDNPTVRPVDLVRTAVFISTLGVLSGALAGGVENRAVIRHLALFQDRP